MRLGGAPGAGNRAEPGRAEPSRACLAPPPPPHPLRFNPFGTEQGLGEAEEGLAAPRGLPRGSPRVRGAHPTRDSEGRLSLCPDGERASERAANKAAQLA